MNRADEVASMLKKFTNANAYKVAGQFANIELWISVSIHALESLANYYKSFDRMFAAQLGWVQSHGRINGFLLGLGTFVV